MKVATRLTLGFGIVTVLGVLAAVWAALVMHAQATQLDEIANNRMRKIAQFTQIKEHILLAGRYTRDMFLNADPSFRANIQSQLSEIKKQDDASFAALDQTIVLARGLPLYKELKAARAAFDAKFFPALELILNDDLSDALQALNDANAAQNQLYDLVEKNRALQQKISSDMAESALETSQRTAWILSLLAAFMFILSTVTAWMLIRQLKYSLGAEPQELGLIARRVASGDLSAIQGADHAARGSVLESLAAMQTSLADIVHQVRSSSDSIATGATQIASGNADLSQRTEEQASNLQQTTASMHQMADSVRNNAGVAEEARSLAGTASHAAVKGGEMVSGVISTMNDISTSSRKISDIIGVIDGIAFQTNILALNAAVEAARAGEQGRGFAVVAGEVRSLAQRSAEAAREIKTLIGASVERVEAGSRQVDEAGTAMREIVDHVQRVTDMINDMSATSSEQATGISQVSDAVNQLDQVTQQNAALVEESAAAAESLRSQATRLTELVRTFKLQNDFSEHGKPASAPIVAEAQAKPMTRIAARTSSLAATRATSRAEPTTPRATAPAPKEHTPSHEPSNLSAPSVPAPVDSVDTQVEPTSWVQSQTTRVGKSSGSNSASIVAHSNHAHTPKPAAPTADKAFAATEPADDDWTTF